MYKDGLELNSEVLNIIKKWYVKAKKDFDLIIIVVGGGKLSREVGGMVKGYFKNVEDRHSVAMELTQTNAHILKGYLGDKSIFNPESLGDAYEFLMDGKGVMISGGLKHGWSTDMDAAVFADIVGERRVYKLSDIEGLYTEDPKANPKAKIIKDITWDKYRKMFGIVGKSGGHTPNLHIPISVECAIFSQNKGITFWISGGNILSEKSKLELVFESGTHIHV